MKEKHTLGITFGVMGETILEQLKEQGYTLNNTGNHRKSNRGEYIEEIRTAFNELRMSGFLTESEADKVNKRMMKYIVKYLKSINKKPDTTASLGIPNKK